MVELAGVGQVVVLARQILVDLVVAVAVVILIMLVVAVDIMVDMANGLELEKVAVPTIPELTR